MLDIVLGSKILFFLFRVKGIAGIGVLVVVGFVYLVFFLGRRSCLEVEGG